MVYDRAKLLLYVFHVFFCLLQCLLSIKVFMFLAVWLQVIKNPHKRTAQDFFLILFSVAGVFKSALFWSIL